MTNVIATTARPKKYRYSEKFLSVQGEGFYTGRTTAWLRLWGCNFDCAGFGQDSTDKGSWDLDYQKIDMTGINELEQLPVWHKGCDSSYSWAKKFINLAKTETAEKIVAGFEDMLTSEFNPGGKFLNLHSKMETHMAFTGGEPMMSQHAINAIMKEFHARQNMPLYVTVETNGTQYLKDDTIQLLSDFQLSDEFGGLVEDSRGNPEWFWSVSPKLSISGEKWAEAIRPDIVKDYASQSNRGQLKFVCDNTKESWDEVAEATNEFRKAGVDWDVYIMPVGATMESQQDHQKAICLEAMKRGYHFAPRVHTWIFGNAVGT
jgi:organic radical activating enzyme